MPRQAFDKSSKWLLQHHGAAILYLGGARDVRRCRALQAEVVQPRQLPDGLLEVHLRGAKKPHYVVVELTTYAERRVEQQALDDLLLVHQDRRELPDVLVVVLRPKGRQQIEERTELHGPLGWSGLAARWKVVNLWELEAEELLATDDVGLVPWVPLTKFEGPPEPILEKCRERIDRQAPEVERANLLAVTQVYSRLRFKPSQYLSILGGRRVMIESPLIQELVAEARHKDILKLLNKRFGEVPADLVNLVRSVVKERKLDLLFDLALDCPSLASFRDRAIEV
jgi:predicted transposase YdaD